MDYIIGFGLCWWLIGCVRLWQVTQHRPTGIIDCLFAFVAAWLWPIFRRG